MPQRSDSLPEPVLLIEGCNFSDFPRGGQLSFCQELIKAFPCEQFRLVGITTDRSDPVGSWMRKKLGGRYVDFLAVRYRGPNLKPVIPARLAFLLGLLRWRKSIFLGHPGKVITNAPESLFAISGIRGLSVLHFLHGVENPLDKSRYRWAFLFRTVFWRAYLRVLDKVDYLAAAADERHIEMFKTRYSIRRDISSFPTRFDDLVFNCGSQVQTVRHRFVCSGRLSAVKDHRFMIDAFSAFRKKYGVGELIIIGDGELREKLEEYVVACGLGSIVRFLGFLKPEELADQLRRANVYLMTSHFEGWSTALIEALACGLPTVVTDVSGADYVISNGRNGFVVKSRHVGEFADFMYQASLLSCPNGLSVESVAQFRTSNMASKLFAAFGSFFFDERRR